jgi:hypothetical protein
VGVSKEESQAILFSCFKKETASLSLKGKVHGGGTRLPDVVFKPKIPIWVNFGGSRNERCFFIFYGHFGLYYGHLVYLVAIWYTL